MTGPKLTVQPYGVFGEDDRLAGERAIEGDELAPPFDLAIRAHAPDLVVDRIVGLAQDAVPAPAGSGGFLPARQ